MQEFVAIDFETANEQRRSACAVGLVRFDQEGNPQETYHQLLRPHPEVDYFNPINTWVHGITAQAVAGQPQWDQVYAEVRDFIADRPLVAHNMAFDGYVLSDLCATYELEALPNPRFCTLRLARKLLADQVERKTLDSVHGFYFPGESFKHHDAYADAQACGRVFARMQAEHGFDYLEQLSTSAGGYSSPRGEARVNQLVVEELLQRYGHSRALEGERVTITGTLHHGQRAAVEQLITAVGGVPEKNLTKKTTILVVGIPNPNAWAEGSSASRKLIAATKLREAGSPIEVVTEDEFFQRLSD